VSLYARFPDLYRRVFPLRPVVVERVVAAVGPPPRAILDLGCGPGDLAGALAARGYHVTGVDLDADMIAAARRAYPTAVFHRRDLREVGRLAGPFAAAVCVGNVLPHVPAADLPAFLADLARLLPPGAAWLVQTVNWDALAGSPSYTFPVKELGDGRTCHRSYTRLPDGGVRFRLAVLAEDGAVLHDGAVTLHPCPSDELDRCHAAAGFRREARWADFAGSPFVPDRPGGCVTLYRRTGGGDSSSG